VGRQIESALERMSDVIEERIEAELNEIHGETKKREEMLEGKVEEKVF
jgi:hypothetical protein